MSSFSFQGFRITLVEGERRLGWELHVEESYVRDVLRGDCSLIHTQRCISYSPSACRLGRAKLPGFRS